MLKIKLDMKLKVSFCNDVLLSDYHSTSRTLFAKIKLDASNLFLKRSNVPNAGEQSIQIQFLCRESGERFIR